MPQVSGLRLTQPMPGHTVKPPSEASVMASLFSPRDMLARLVGFPTVSSRSNLDLVDFVGNYLDDYGAVYRRIPDATGEKASLVARIGPDTEGGIVLSGHSDVVPVEGQDWSSDPFVLTERDGRLYGRGTCDMKGFCAAALSLVPEMQAAELRRPIYIALSRDEETGCLGAPEMIDDMLAHFPRPSAVIVGEPSTMKVVTAHKGSWGFRAHLRGHEVHSSRLHSGVSAVMTAARLIGWMEDRTLENAERAAPGDLDPNWTTLHVGMIGGGTATNITARDCSFAGEVRVIPEESVDDWRERIGAEAARLTEAMQRVHPDTGITLETRMQTPGLSPEPDGIAEPLMRALTGDNSRNAVPFQTEAGQFQEAGLSTVICGPGSITQAHQPDEYIETAQLDACTAMMRRLIARLAA